MDREDFRVKLARTLEVPDADLVDAYPLEGEHWDSLAVLSTIALVDEELGVAVDASALESCTCVGALLDAIERAASSPSA